MCEQCKKRPTTANCKNGSEPLEIRREVKAEIISTECKNFSTGEVIVTIRLTPIN